MSPTSLSLTEKVVNSIKNNTNKVQSKYTKDLLNAAEQRINFVYLMMMVAVEAAILIYLLVNEKTEAIYYFGFRSGAVLLPGIVINIVCRKKSYPWIKYVNNLLLMASFFFLGGYTDLIALLFILLPFINSFYYRPYFTAVSGLACVIMMYFCFMSITAPFYDENDQIIFNFFLIVEKAFDFSDEIVVYVLENRSFLIIMAIMSVVVSTYLSVNSRRFTIRQAELMSTALSTEAEMNVARDIQKGILSVDFPDNESYGVYADMTTATEVGGDFYDYFLIDESHLAIVIGDVSGHGMSAAMFMTLSKTLIKVYAQSHHSVEKVFELTNRYLQRSNPAKFFVTSWLGIVDLTTGAVTYSNAGHNYPVIIRKGEKPKFLKAKPYFVLGRKRLIRYRENRIKIKPGDKLVLYTDGVTEAKSPDGGFFGDDRLLEVMESAKEQDPKELVLTLRRTVTAFEEEHEHYDDATVLALSFRSLLKVEEPKRKTFFLTKGSFDTVTDYIIEECQAAGCDEEAINRISVATSELLANLCSYAYENGGELEILTKCRDRRMMITFIDSGPPFNPLLVKEPDVTLALNERTPGGLGIFIVKKMMSDVNYVYENQHNMLTIEKEF